MQSRNRSLVWGILLILFGAALLIQVYVDLTAWMWVAILAVGGAAVYGVYLMDRSQRALLIPAYVLWVIALMVALITLDVLRDDAIATYVLTAIALPFVVVYARDRERWWALIPAWILLAIALMLALIELNVLRDESVATFVLAAIALPFVVLYARDREKWWALIPAYALLAVGVMVGLIGQGVLDDLLIPAYVMFAVAIPFFVVYLRNRDLWWALVPGGIMGVIGLAFLLAEGAVQYIGPIALVVVGIWILLRQLKAKEPTAPDA